MRLHQVLGESRRLVLEYGRRGFPGYGMGLFSQRHYEFMVNHLHDVADPQARTWLVDWLCEVFQRDNSKFKADRFKQAVTNDKQYNARPSFEQRHFYYLAQWVKDITDPHVHDFVRDWLGEVVGGTNANFKPSTWAKYCDQAEPKPVKPVTGQPPPDEELQEAPGFGSRGHGGFGQRFFTKSHYLSIAADLGAISDVAIRQHMIEWWVKLFKLDNPAFKAEAFEQAAQQRGLSAPNGRWQQRHFYFIAHEISEIADMHERKFVCDWFAQNIGRTNPDFQVARWEKYCHLDADEYERKAVTHDRAKAQGEPVGEHPSEERYREWLKKNPQYARNDVAEGRRR